MTARWTGLAADLGASSGRVLAAQFDGSRLNVEEIHRFENEPVYAGSTLHWDILRLFHEIKSGVRKAQQTHKTINSIAIDTWAIDFGLLDKAGNLLGNPVHYRDHRNDGVMERVCNKLKRKEIFRHSGIQFLPFNTIYQLAGMQDSGHPHMDYAHHLLLIPDLLGYFFTGEKAGEFTNVTTTQLLEPATGDWSRSLIEKLRLPKHIFPKITQPGTVLGPLLPKISEELGGLQTKFITGATHDTACAVAATPAKSKPFAYLSCGTWSLLGTEIDAPILSDKALELNVTNEGGVCDTYRLLKNIMGLWLLQELKREWERAGRKLSWQEMTALTAQAPAFVSLIDPDDARFLAAGDMAVRVRDACREKSQKIPENEGALLRCITESLALKYRWVLERIEDLTGERNAALHMVGGGIQNELLCQWTANACGRPVIAGPVEATALGNIAVQMLAAGEVSSLAQAREIIAASSPMKTYEPAQTAQWDEAYGRMKTNFGF